MGCNFLLQGIFPRDCTYVSCIGVYLYILESHLVMSNSLGPHGPWSPWNSPGQTTGVGNLSLLQGIVPTQGSKPGLPHCRQIFFFQLELIPFLLNKLHLGADYHRPQEKMHLAFAEINTVQQCPGSSFREVNLSLEEGLRRLPH